MLFRASNIVVFVVVVAVIAGTTALGVVVGRRFEQHRDEIREPVGAVQTAVLGFVGLLLAFGLTMAVGRYEARRGAVVTEANAIGTAYLRAQTIGEPERSTSLDLLTTYASERRASVTKVAQTRGYDDSVGRSTETQRALWSLATSSLRARPTDSAPRLYVESLNVMFDAGASREAAFVDRIPASVLYLQLFGAAAALGVLGLYLSLLGRRVLAAALAAAMVSLIMLVAIDLDRPQRGLITVSTRALDSVIDQMQHGPAAPAG